MPNSFHENSLHEKEATSTEIGTRVRGRYLGWVIITIVAMFVLVYFYITVSTCRCDQGYSEARILVLQEIMSRDTFVNSPEVNGFSPNYDREIRLFKAMSHDEQHKYLNMTRDEKFAHYGKLLN
jgi:hypothetical protein